MTIRKELRELQKQVDQSLNAPSFNLEKLLQSVENLSDRTGQIDYEIHNAIEGALLPILEGLPLRNFEENIEAAIDAQIGTVDEEGNELDDEKREWRTVYTGLFNTFTELEKAAQMSKKMICLYLNLHELKQEEIAKRLNVSQPTLARWIRQAEDEIEYKERG